MNRCYMRVVDFKKLYLNGMPKILHMGYAEDHIPFLSDFRCKASRNDAGSNKSN